MQPPREIRLIPVPFVDEVVPGDNLAEKLRVSLRHQKLSLRTGDVVVIKHKVVSKSEAQIVFLSNVKASSAARSWARQCGTDARLVELALSESRQIVRKNMVSKQKGVLITETRHGLVCANSGVDASNVDGGASAVLLPTDPDRSAARLRSQIKKLLSV